MLEGAGGNIGVSVGPDGILIVDDQFAPLADKIKAALRTLGDGKLKFVLNTHYHGDHTGANAAFGPEALIIAQENVRKRLSTEQVSKFFKRTTPASPKQALPVVTFDHAVSVFLTVKRSRSYTSRIATPMAIASSSLLIPMSFIWETTFSIRRSLSSIWKREGTFWE